jgi:tRNA A-37 threonylcarbamoyl transferase component Bud32
MSLASESYQEVVLKIGYHRGQLQPDGSDGCSFLRRELAFYRELESRNLSDLAPALLDALDQPRKVILALEHIAGTTLLTQHLAGQVTVDQLEHCWSILARLHGAGLYVGDAKLGNFLFGKDGRIRIFDFETAGVAGVPQSEMRTFVLEPSPSDPRKADLAHFLISVLYPYEEKGRNWEHRFVDVSTYLDVEVRSPTTAWAREKLRALMPAGEK